MLARIVGKCSPTSKGTVDGDWDDDVLREQVRALQRHGPSASCQPAVVAAAGKRSASGASLGLGDRRSARRAVEAPLPRRREAATAAAAGSQARAALPMPATVASAQLAPNPAGPARAKGTGKGGDETKPKAANAKSKAKAKAKAKAAATDAAGPGARCRKAGSTAQAGMAQGCLPVPLSNHRHIRVGTECSGMEPVAMALRNLGALAQCSLEFCCEIDKWCHNFILQNHPPKRFFEDITIRDPFAAPPCDLYVAGFPCQPFSRAGLRQGVDDVKGRGTIFEHILSYLRAHRPRAVILENVAGLKDKVFADTFKEMLNVLREIKGPGGRPHYIVSKRVVDTAAWGLPHSRKRIYIVCLSQDHVSRTSPFRWPRPSTATKPIEEILQPARGGDTELSALGPKCRDRLVQYLEKLRARGDNPEDDPWIINVFGRDPHGMRGRCPCLTRARAGSGGHWVSNRSRLLSIEEMLALQGMPADVRREGISNRQLGLMIGNAMSVNVLERILVRLLPGVGLLPPVGLHDRWT